ncbi:hypothetical protein [Thioalkalivibrio nitratireducens]|nr:hypothetical protein [Thioalkalivibrio nitratireducens]
MAQPTLLQALQTDEHRIIRDALKAAPGSGTVLSAGPFTNPPTHAAS